MYTPTQRPLRWNECFPVIVCTVVMGIVVGPLAAIQPADQLNEPGVDVTRIAVLDQPGRVPEQLRRDLEDHDVALGEIEPWHVDWRLITIPDEKRNVADVTQLVADLAALEVGRFVSPVLIDEFGGLMMIKPEVLVRFEPDVNAAMADVWLIVAGAGEVLDRDWAGMERAYRVRPDTRSGWDVVAVSNMLSALPDVTFAEPNMVFTAYTNAPPNDPSFADQWALQNVAQNIHGPCMNDGQPILGGNAGFDIGVLDAWEVTTGDSEIIVVVFDSGVQQDHPDINQIPGADFTSDSSTDGGPVNICDNHGTPVAGIIAGLKNNGIGVSGAAPEVVVASARVMRSTVFDGCPGTGTMSTDGFVEGLAWAESIGARVTNTSLSMGNPSEAIAAKFADTRAGGMMHFGSAGNNSQGQINFPSSATAVNSVAALDKTGLLAHFSNWGEGLAFSAPGIHTISSDRTGNDGYTDGDVTCFGGTSAAAPYAAAVAALILSVDDSLTPTEVDLIMAASTIDLGEPGYNTTYGWGLVHAGNALAHTGVVHNVPQEYSTIQSAILAADSGDIIMVASGTYQEHIDFMGKTVHLRSDAGSAETILDGAGQGSVITSNAKPGSRPSVRGFTITGGAGTLAGSTSRGGGIYSTGADISVSNCEFYENAADEGSAIYSAEGGLLTLTSNYFCNNSSEQIEGQWQSIGGNVFLDICGEYPSILHVPGQVPTIQYALNVSADGAEVVVAPGVYAGAIDFEGKEIHLRSTDGPEVTYIHPGGATASVITAVNGEGPETILDGFTITGGSGTFIEHEVGSGYVGGGMFIKASSPTIINCIFLGNDADYGGGMMNWDGAAPNVLDCVFVDNVATPHGGGMYNLNALPTVEHSSFRNGTASWGGGMYNRDSAPTVSHSAFESNTAFGGGGMMNSESDATIDQCMFQDNTATGEGGGLHNRSNSNPVITNSTFQKNVAEWRGGGVFNQDSSPTVTGSGFIANVADTFGGGMSNIGSSFPTITNCVFQANLVLSNVDDAGGAIRNSHASVSAVGNTTFCNNDPDAIAGSWEDLGQNDFTCPQTFSVPEDFATIQQAIQSVPDGAEIVVGPGTYTEAITFNSKAVHLRSSNGPHSTVLDGTGLGVSVLTALDSNDSAIIVEGFTINSGEGTIWPPNPSMVVGGGMWVGNSTVAVSNCVFVDNHAQFGGGMFIEAGSDVALTDCTFLENSADGGGGLYNWNSSVEITDCTFDGNAAITGGAMINVDGEVEAVNSVFRANDAEYQGGGVFNFNDSELSIVGCAFQSNTAQQASNAYNDEPGYMEIGVSFFCDLPAGHIEGEWVDLGDNEFFEDCDSGVILVPQDFVTIQQAIDAVVVFAEIVVAPGEYNEAIDFKGKAIHLRSVDGAVSTIINASGMNTSAVAVRSGEGPDTILEGFTIMGGNGSPLTSDPDNIAGGGMLNEDSSPTIIKCIFTQNTAMSGAGMANVASHATVINCVFESNVAEGEGGGMLNVYDSLPTVTNSWFTDNAASLGGGMFNVYDSHATVDGCQFVSNAAEYGGGMYNLQSSPTVTECLFENNDAQHFGGGMLNGFGSSPLLTNCIWRNNSAIDGGGMLNGLESTPTIVDSAFEGNTADEGGGIYGFADSPSTIAVTSFCDNQPEDIIGPWNDDDGNEFLAECPPDCEPADLNCDGVVDVSDLLILLANWGPCSPSGDCPADINGNGTVDVSDLLILLANWG